MDRPAGQLTRPVGLAMLLAGGTEDPRQGLHMDGGGPGPSLHTTSAGARRRTHRCAQRAREPKSKCQGWAWPPFPLRGLCRWREGRGGQAVSWAPRTATPRYTGNSHNHPPVTEDWEARAPDQRPQSQDVAKPAAEPRSCQLNPCSFYPMATPLWNSHLSGGSASGSERGPQLALCFLACGAPGQEQ